MRLLLAEDEKDLSKALCAILKHNNYSVDPVYNGEDAYDYGMSENYDGIILDLMMPKMNGIDVLKKLRKNGISTPVLILTAKAQTEDKIIGLDSGADDKAVFNRRAACAHSGNDAQKKRVFAQSSHARQPFAQPGNL